MTPLRNCFGGRRRGRRFRIGRGCQEIVRINCLFPKYRGKLVTPLVSRIKARLAILTLSSKYCSIHRSCEELYFSFRFAYLLLHSVRQFIDIFGLCESWEAQFFVRSSTTIFGDEFMRSEGCGDVVPEQGIWMVECPTFITTRHSRSNEGHFRYA